MNDVYDFNRALNHEAELVLVADGHTPACDTDGNPIRTGFLMGLDPQMTPQEPRVMVLFLYPQIFTPEESKRARTSPEARERVLTERARRHDREMRELLPAFAESLSRAGWTAEVHWKGRSVEAAPPRSVIRSLT